MIVITAFGVMLASIAIQEYIELYNLREQRKITDIIDRCGDIESLSQRISFLTLSYIATGEKEFKDKLKERSVEHVEDFEKTSNYVLTQIRNDSQTFTDRSRRVISHSPFYLEKSLRQFIRVTREVIQNDGQRGSAYSLRAATLSAEVYRGVRALRDRLAGDANRKYARLALIDKVLLLFNILSILGMGIFVLYYLVTKLREEQLSRRRAELQLTDQIEELETFTGVVAHDLKGPLNNIYLFGNMLLDNEKLKAEEFKNPRSAVEVIVSQSEKLSEMIQALLTFFKNSSQRIRKKRVQLKNVVGEICDRLKMQIEQKGATVDCRHSRNVYVDEALFLNILQNLVQNSLLYAGVEDLKIMVSSRKLSYAVEVLVEDNGVGIASEELDKIFKPFQRGKSSESQEGSGLGLAFVKKIVKLHGGEIHVENKPSGGVRFKMLFPNN